MKKEIIRQLSIQKGNSEKSIELGITENISMYSEALSRFCDAALKFVWCLPEEGFGSAFMNWIADRFAEVYVQAFDADKNCRDLSLAFECNAMLDWHRYIVKKMMAK